MIDISLLNNDIVQNLKDAGCADEFIETYTRINGEDNIKEQLDLLSKHREELLNTVHKNQKRIDFLDYLIYKIKKQPK